jgi:hypothetical protein
VPNETKQPGKQQQRLLSKPAPPVKDKGERMTKSAEPTKKS